MPLVEVGTRRALKLARNQNRVPPHSAGAARSATVVRLRPHNSLEQKLSGMMLVGKSWPKVEVQIPTNIKPFGGDFIGSYPVQRGDDESRIDIVFKTTSPTTVISKQAVAICTLDIYARRLRGNDFETIVFVATPTGTKLPEHVLIVHPSTEKYQETPGWLFRRRTTRVPMHGGIIEILSAKPAKARASIRGH